MVRSERGFSLIEVIVAVGIVAAIAIGGLGFTLSSRALQVSAAAEQFDALLTAARTMAGAFTYGVTIAFVPDGFGDGFVARVYENRPHTAPLASTTLPSLTARVALRETQTLGVPAFALTIHANGSVAGILGDIRAQAAAETPCPPSGAFHLVFSYGGAQAARDVPCRIVAATTGPPVLASVPPALPLPLPTIAPCVGAACAQSSAPPIAAVTPVAVAVYFAGPTAIFEAAQPAGQPQPCAGYPLYDHAGGTTGNGAGGGWFEDDWYSESIATTVGAFVVQHAGADGWWNFDGDSFGVRGGSYLDPAQVGVTFRAVGTYGASTSIEASAVSATSLRAQPPATAVNERDYLHESCYAAWQDAPGG